MSDRPFVVLVVCVGNVCRSPAGKYLLRAALSEALPAEQRSAIVVASRGTQAPEGEPVQPLTARALAARGVDASDHVARRLTAADLERADLVLTAERSVRSDTVQVRPASVAIAFTLTEFARLAAAAGPVADLPGLVREARSLRGFVRPRRPQDDDIADPMGWGGDEHERAVAATEAACKEIVAALARALMTQ